MFGRSLIICLILSVLIVDATQLLSSVANHRHSRLLGLLKRVQKTHTHAPLAPPLDLSAKAAYNFAVDFAVSASLSTLQCLYQQGYNSVFIQVYGPANGGSVNSAGCQAVINSYSANLGTEIYITPATSGKTGQQQFDEAFNAMKSAGINVRSVWLQVTSPINWPNNLQTNVNLIQSFINRATSYGISAGIYTNWYDWQQITGAYTGFQSSRLWYWNSLGQGQNAEAGATFDDYRTFGGWSSPAVKQFALNENLCGLTLNRDVYPQGSKSVAELVKQNDKPTVGGFV
uniref:Lysozyme n=1 Tax=Panagrolaimus sp. ES5 TaxID=591445 RepID=A0AC34FN65_9BILA